MKKILLLSFVIAVSAPLTAHAFLTNDDVLSYAAMPLAVSDVCDVRGVQTDQVATLVSYMDRANVSPDQFIDVFRYVPVALVLNSGRRPDFVQWVGSEVDQGVTGDELVTLMERRLTTYGNVVTVSQFHRYHRYHRRPRFYTAAYGAYSPFEPDYVPVVVHRYCDAALLDPFALIDMPVAVATVVDLGVPVARVGGLVLQLDLGYVPPLQTVELLRYSPPALLAVNYGQPDFVQYVYNQRVGGLSGVALVQAVDQQLPLYGVTPQIDLASPVYIGQNAWVPGVVQNYVAPVDPAFVPPVVRTQVASFAAGRGSYTAPAAPPVASVAPSPQAQRLLDQRGNAVVTSPAQARRELAQSMRSNRHAAQIAGGAAAASVAAATALQRGHGARGRIASGPAVAAARVNGAHVNGRGHHAAVMTGRPARSYAARQNVMAPQHVRGGGMHAAGPAMRAARPHPQVMQQHGRPQVSRQPVMAMPRAPQGGQGRGHGGGPPARVMAAPPAPAAVAAPQGQPGRGNGKGNDNGKGQKKGRG